MSTREPWKRTRRRRAACGQVSHGKKVGGVCRYALVAAVQAVVTGARQLGCMWGRLNIGQSSASGVQL